MNRNKWFSLSALAFTLFAFSSTCRLGLCSEADKNSKIVFEVIRRFNSDLTRWMPGYFDGRDGGGFCIEIMTEVGTATVYFLPPSMWTDGQRERKTPRIMINSKNLGSDGGVDATDQSNIKKSLIILLEKKPGNKNKDEKVRQLAIRVLNGQDVWAK